MDPTSVNNVLIGFPKATVNFFFEWTGCLSSYYLSSNFGKYGTSCPSFECICFSETCQPFLYAFTQVSHLCLYHLLDQNVLLIFHWPLKWFLHILLCWHCFFLTVFANVLNFRYNKLVELRDDKMQTKAISTGDSLVEDMVVFLVFACNVVLCKNLCYLSILK